MILNRERRPGRTIDRLRAAAADPAALDALLGEATVPIVEGTSCTFLWRGDADAVGVEHRVTGLPDPVVMRRLRGGGDLWHATVELPPGSRIEYRILVRRGGDIESVLDPLNPKQAHDPSGSKSVLEAGGYETPWWAVADPAVVPGELVEVRIPSRHLKREARVTLYLPVRMRRRDRLPLLVMHDGGDFLNFSGVATVLDNLMHHRLVADTLVALTHPGERLSEYAASPAHSRFLTAELVPRLERTMPLRADPAGRVLAGASMGAIASLAAAVRAPGFYGGLLLQSGTFYYRVAGRSRREGPLEPVLRFVNGIRAAPRLVAERIFLSVGAFEPSADHNRGMAATLQAMAAEFRLVEGLDGHNWISWRDRLLDGLGWLLPGDARLVFP